MNLWSVTNVNNNGKSFNFKINPFYTIILIKFNEII